MIELCYVLSKRIPVQRFWNNCRSWAQSSQVCRKYTSTLSSFALHSWSRGICLLENIAQSSKNPNCAHPSSRHDPHGSWIANLRGRAWLSVSHRSRRPKERQCCRTLFAWLHCQVANFLLPDWYSLGPMFVLIFWNLVYFSSQVQSLSSEHRNYIPVLYWSGCNHADVVSFFCSQQLVTKQDKLCLV